ncbi:elongation of very long chain fatty acids protein AAEL008004-like [Daktulosphaira vitifoliae]|uniref:elongation of very long chain fatty acids protein AAEL008004-like n=1 Tax=Daktulosphaira vitifoliae TaxID=58002 RepID=UPI0021AB009D|nr:elongation of very long chain fatty acids protein AAEL008004-like [Daktulosphaira vitifoliae]
MANGTITGFQDFITDVKIKMFTIFGQELKFDKEADSWLFMPTPWPVLSIIMIYLLFVLNVGPKMMKNRNPPNLKYIILVYNIIQILHNGYMVSTIFYPGIASTIFGSLCVPYVENENPHLFHMFLEYSWHFFISKISDLMDTVFFVLRKKQSHVTFLHTYHHVNMVITTWAHLRYIKGYQGVFYGLINSFIHMVMYTYYFLSALGPQMQKYLWWKVYLTQLQMVQFIIMLIYGVYLYLNDCKFPKIFTIYIAADLLLFLYLFMMFYRRIYNKKGKIE